MSKQIQDSIDAIRNIVGIKVVNVSDALDGSVTLCRNTPVIVDKNHNCQLCINENNTNECLIVCSQFRNNEFAVVGNEFRLSGFLKKPKAVDLSYYYFSECGKVYAYLYDMKQTFAGEEVLLKVFEQWAQSIKTLKACVIQLSNIDSYPAIIGVITEDDDKERRKRELDRILNSLEVSDKILSFIQSQRRASEAENIRKAKILREFDEGEVTIDGCSYKYDIRTFVDKKHLMNFKNGFLEPQDIQI